MDRHVGAANKRLRKRKKCDRVLYQMDDEVNKNSPVKKVASELWVHATPEYIKYSTKHATTDFV